MGKYKRFQQKHHVSDRQQPHIVSELHAGDENNYDGAGDAEQGAPGRAPEDPVAEDARRSAERKKERLDPDIGRPKQLEKPDHWQKPKQVISQEGVHDRSLTVEDPLSDDADCAAFSLEIESGERVGAVVNPGKND